MGLGKFIAESPGKFLALMGAGAAGAVLFFSGEPISKPTNPWSLDPSQRPGSARLEALKLAAEEMAERIGLHFGPPPTTVVAEPDATPEPKVQRAHHGRRHHHHRVE